MLNLSDLPDERFAIAFSGGGDSTALVHALKDHKPVPLVLIVDHALRPGSAAESRAAAEWARSLGLPARRLIWQHKGFTSAIQARARQARYRLMGEACRKVGIRFLLTAHTEDDQAETILMRYDRDTDWRGASGMRPTTYAPIWPELADVTLVRPLLGETRDNLRAYNAAHKLRWAEDPSNQDRAYSRIRARDFLRDKSGLNKRLLRTAEDIRKAVDRESRKYAAFVQDHVTVSPHGILQLRRKPPEKLLEILLLVAAGQGGPIARDKVTQLHSRLGRDDFTSATLGGALISKSETGFIIGRDPSAAKGRHNRPAVKSRRLSPGQSVLWDGRYWIRAADDALTLGTFHDCPDRRKFELIETKGLPDVYRQSLPAIWDQAQTLVAAPALPHRASISIEPVLARRLQDMLR